MGRFQILERDMTAANSAAAKQYQKLMEADAAAHQGWDKYDKELRRFIRVAKVGRRTVTVIPISETRGVEIRNQFKGEIKVFAPAFAKKWKLKEVALENE
jgi:hypothetical protein